MTRTRAFTLTTLLTASMVTAVVLILQSNAVAPQPAGPALTQAQASEPAPPASLPGREPVVPAPNGQPAPSSGATSPALSFPAPVVRQVQQARVEREDHDDDEVAGRRAGRSPRERERD